MNIRFPKILFVGTTCPFGEISGAGLRTLNVLRILSELGSVKAVFATGRHWTKEQTVQTKESFDVQWISHYLETPVRTVEERYRKIFDPHYLNSDGVEVPEADVTRVLRLVEESDVIWVHTLKLANAFRFSRWPKSVLDIDDIPSLYHGYAARHEQSFLKRLLRSQKAFSARRMESLLFERFELLTICKEADRPVFHDSPRVHVVPNGFSVPGEPNGLDSFVQAGFRIGMIGDFNHLPNHDGLRWFIENVWSRVLARVPGAELRLVGKGSEMLGERYCTGSVTGLGYVPSVEDETGTWSCMIVPTRMGGGTHLKVAEGLARRIPIVTTSHGARGYDFISERHALVADEAGEFAHGCTRLLLEPQLRQAISRDGWELFQQRFSWDSIRPAVEKTVEHCLERSGRAKKLAVTPVP